MPYSDPEKQRAAQRASHERLRDQRRLSARIRKEESREKFKTLKESTPCADCGKRYPFYVMQFDHVRGTKVGNINTLLANRQFAKAWEEVKKCEIVCSNCHAIRTYTRQPKGSEHPRWAG